MTISETDRITAPPLYPLDDAQPLASATIGGATGRLGGAVTISHTLNPAGAPAGAVTYHRTGPPGGRVTGYQRMAPQPVHPPDVDVILSQPPQIEDTAGYREAYADGFWDAVRAAAAVADLVPDIRDAIEALAPSHAWREVSGRPPVCYGDAVIASDATTAGPIDTPPPQRHYHDATTSGHPDYQGWHTHALTDHPHRPPAGIMAAPEPDMDELNDWADSLGYTDC